MFGSEILEVAIGVIFVYILVSVICSAIREGIEAWLKTRAAYLEYGIRELLHDRKAEGLAKSFFNHPLIYSLFSSEYKPPAHPDTPAIFARGANLPSYIPAANFALALMDIAARGPETDAVSSDPSSPVISLEAVRSNVLNLRNPPVQRLLLTAIDSAQGDLNKAQANIAAWFDSGMDRVSGWYKRSTHWILFSIGLVIAAGMNINTIVIADYLYRNDAARTALVARAEKAATDTANPSPKFKEAKDALNALGLPMGWTVTPDYWRWPDAKLPARDRLQVIWSGWVVPLLGWLLTGLAATMGAPFWFDVLNKVMVIRSTVKPHEKSPEESSEDRQKPPAAPVVAPVVIAGGGAAQQPAAGAPPPVPPAPPPPAAAEAAPRDEESGIDGCDVTPAQPTPDEELPAAEGGVAP
jgi:hypothetical protein